MITLMLRLIIFKYLLAIVKLLLFIDERYLHQKKFSDVLKQKIRFPIERLPIHQELLRHQWY